MLVGNTEVSDWLLGYKSKIIRNVFITFLQKHIFGALVCGSILIVAIDSMLNVQEIGMVAVYVARLSAAYSQWYTGKGYTICKTVLVSVRQLQQKSMTIFVTYDNMWKYMPKIRDNINQYMIKKSVKQSTD